MIEAAGGDELKAGMLQLFSHWSNDIQSLSPHYGICLGRDEYGELVVNENIPPSPSLEHSWDGSQWVMLDDNWLEEAAVQP